MSFADLLFNQQNRCWYKCAGADKLLFSPCRRSFGTLRVGSNLVPDDINGLPSTHMAEHLGSHKDNLLYEAEMDHGRGFRCLRCEYCLILTPCGLVWLFSRSLFSLCKMFSCDEACLWVRKEYSTRTYFRIYPNRIETNYPKVRFPFGYLGCGSWNADNIVAYPFDRGAFGFSHVKSLTCDHLCFTWPVYGGSVARRKYCRHRHVEEDLKFHYSQFLCRVF